MQAGWVHGQSHGWTEKKEKYHLNRTNEQYVALGGIKTKSDNDPDCLRSHIYFWNNSVAWINGCCKFINLSFLPRMVWDGDVGRETECFSCSLRSWRLLDLHSALNCHLFSEGCSDCTGTRHVLSHHPGKTHFLLLRRYKNFLSLCCQVPPMDTEPTLKPKLLFTSCHVTRNYRETFSIRWFTVHMAPTVSCRAGQSQEQGLHLCFPHLWQGPKYLGHLLLFSGQNRGAGSEVKQQRHKLLPKRNASIKESGLPANLQCCLYFVSFLISVGQLMDGHRPAKVVNCSVQVGCKNNGCIFICVAATDLVRHGCSTPFPGFLIHWV